MEWAYQVLSAAHVLLLVCFAFIQMLAASAVLMSLVPAKHLFTTSVLTCSHTMECHPRLSISSGRQLEGSQFLQKQGLVGEQTSITRMQQRNAT